MATVLNENNKSPLELEAELKEREKKKKEKKTKKEKKVKQKNESNKKNNQMIIIVLSSLIVAGAAFAFLLNVEKNMIQQYEKSSVIVCTKEIPENTIISKDNFNTYFGIQEMETNLIPKTAYINEEDMYGLSPIYNINDQTVITKNMFVDDGKIREEIGTSVEVSFVADSISSSVAGGLRTGDFINIYTKINKLDEFGYPTEEQTYATKTIWQKVYIIEAYNSNGEKISVSDKDSKAVLFTVLLNKDKVIDFYNDLYDSSMQIIKVTDLVNSDEFEYDVENLMDSESYMTNDDANEWLSTNENADNYLDSSYQEEFELSPDELEISTENTEEEIIAE